MSAAQFVVEYDIYHADELIETASDPSEIKARRITQWKSSKRLKKK
jgi:hypothetical protein